MKFDKEVRDFIIFVQTQAGVEWRLRLIYLAGIGWQVEWRCGDRSLKLAPAMARKLSRYMKGEFRRITLQQPADQRNMAKDAEMCAWADHMDGLGRDALLKTRDKAVPETLGEVPA